MSHLFCPAVRMLIAVSAISICTGASLAETLQVIDGDTIRMGEVTFRLHGIDAPEAGQTCNDASGGSWRCGDEATRHLEGLIGSQMPVCQPHGIDDYERVLAVCVVAGVEINRRMVLDGYAWAFRRYSDDYGPDEDVAAASGIHIWQAATQSPWDYRAAKWEVAVQEAPDGCPIKGNISENGHIYHAPWSPWYSKTKVSVDRGERWFCSEGEALDAGWRAPIWGH